jgi:hypothetical protein
MRTSIPIFTGLVLISTACTTAPPRADRADRVDQRVAYVRVVSTVSSGSAVDIFAGDRKVFSEIKPGAMEPYREVPRGLTTFRARWAGRDSETPIAENIELLGEKEYSTILLRPGGRDGKSVAMTVFDDHVWAPSAGKAKVRLVHAIPGMADIDVYSQGKRVLGGVDFRDTSRYVEVEPATGDLELKRDDNQQTVATVPNVRLEGNKAYTVLLAGENANPKTIVLEDRAEEEPIMTEYPPLIH